VPWVSIALLVLCVISRSLVPLILLVPVAPLLVALNLSALRKSLVRARQIVDLPTSRIGSAAQGYIELVARAEPLGEAVVLDPLHQQPVLW